ncbi:MAG: hypothetical protein PWP37_102 [Thermotogota bacterium]|nr:hypothetical protein [Thermotogota bacterium]MDK2863910.1 hypothetical protein [Thermotogota bacterium]HCZ06655.1 hypothetical protein [Thermotogota bacterium]
MRILLILTVSTLLCSQILALNMEDIVALSKLPETLEESVDQLIAYIIQNKPAYDEVAAAGRLVYAKRALGEELPEKLFRAVCAQNFNEFLLELSRYRKKISLKNPKLLCIIFPKVEKELTACLSHPDSECVTKMKNLVLIEGFLKPAIDVDASASIEWTLENALRLSLVFDEIFGEFISSVFGDSWFEKFWESFETKIDDLEESDYPRVELLAKHLHGKGKLVELIGEYMRVKLMVTEFTGKAMLGTEDEVQGVIAELPSLLEQFDSLKTKKELLKDLLLTLFDVLNKRIETIKDIDSIRVETLPRILNISDPTLRKSYYDLLAKLSLENSGIFEKDRTEKTMNVPSTTVKWPWWIVFFAVAAVFTLPSVRYVFYRLFGLKKLQVKSLTHRIQKNPLNGELHLKLGQVYESLGKYEDAVREYSLAVKLMEKTPVDNEHMPKTRKTGVS